MDIIVVWNRVVAIRLRPARETAQVRHRFPYQIGHWHGFLRRTGDKPELARADQPDGVSQPLRHVRVLARRAGADGEDQEGVHGEFGYVMRTGLPSCVNAIADGCLRPVAVVGFGATECPDRAEAHLFWK